MKKIGVFPGSFDPFTKGHEAIVRKSLTIFDEVIIAIGVNSSKSYLFSLEKRIAHISSIFVAEKQVSVKTYQTLTVDLCKESGARHIIRGLRDGKDFDYEKSIALMNRSISDIETVFLLTELEYSAINSTIVREIYKNNGDISSFVTNLNKLV